MSSADSKAERPSRVLVVDDVPDNVDLLAEHLEDHGYEVVTAENGIQAIEQWKKTSPDIMLLDVMMPGMSGIEVCERIRGQQTREQFMPILLVTALNDIASKTKGLNAGAEDFITKPFNAEELLARVKAHLRAKTFHDRLSRANAALEEERDKIAAIQASLLPDSLPNNEQLRVAAKYLPSDKASGDYYDVIEIQPGKWALTVADVSGHGTPAAVVMAVTKALLISHTARESDPAVAIGKLNAELCRVIKTGEFVTMSYTVLDLATRTLTYANAGHHNPILVRKGQPQPIMLKNKMGFPLVIDPDNPLDTLSIQLEPGDRVLIYTDGIVEAVNPQNDMYGGQRLKDVCVATAATTPNLAAWIDAVLADLTTFCAGEPLRDDVTTLAFEIPG